MNLATHTKQVKIRVIGSISILSCWLLLCLTLPAHARGESLVLGIHPYLPANQIMLRFRPLADYLAQQLDRPVEVRVGQSYQDHLQAIQNNQIDIAFLGPALYAELLRRHHPSIPLVKFQSRDKQTLRGRIIVSRYSQIQQLSELRGKTFAFGDPHSTLSSLLPQALLLQAGIRLTDFSFHSFYPGHVNVALAVLGGDADAGAVKEDIYRHFAPHGLRSIARTAQVPEHLFIANANLPTPQIDAIKQAFLALNQPGRVTAVLKPIKTDLSGIVSAQPSDYRDLIDVLDKLDHE